MRICNEQDFSQLSFVQRCALLETKNERKEINPDKDLAAFYRVQSNNSHKRARIKKRFIKYMEKLRQSPQPTTNP